jgi:AsmA protein
MSRRTRLLLIIAGSVVGAAVLILVAVNLLISADWVRERVADRIKEQTGRELTVNGTTSLLFTPGPHVVITDAAFIDPEERAGTTDFSVARLVIDLTLSELLSRNVDAERIVLERPVITLRLGDEEPKQKKTKTAKSENRKPHQDVKLRDVRVEDGTVNIVTGGKEKRVEHITANFSLPALSEPFTGSGKFEWKEQTVEFNIELTTFADLRQQRAARLQFTLDTPALAARFDGSFLTRPSLTGQGSLSARAHSIPSLLAWMREKPDAITGIGDGELTSHVDWKKDEIAFSNIRFGLEHASGQGQAIVGLGGKRPHVRAALALDNLDLNPFLSGVPGAGKAGGGPSAPKPGQEGASNTGNSAAPAAQPASPAAFDADVNLNVSKIRVFHLDLGPSSIGLAFRDGVLNATLGDMELYGGHARGTLMVDAAKPVPVFGGNFTLDGVQAKPLLSDAAQFSLLEGQTQLALQINGTGSNADEIKSSLQGQGNIAVSDGAIDGIDITEMIETLGAGDIPELRQGPDAKTKFSELGGSFTIQNGIAETNDVTVKSPLLKIDATGTVNIAQSTIKMLANPEIVAGAEGQNGANDLAGLSVPVRIEGPLDRPTIKPDLKGVLANPDKVGKAVNQIGKALQKKFKGKPVGEAIGRFLGDIQVESRGEDGKKESKKAKPDSNGGSAQEDEATQPEDPDIERILR